jgi:membrane protein
MRRLPQRLFEFYWGQGIADDVPALTYYLVLSLAPFALGLAALHALLLKDVVSALQVAETVNRFLPHALHGDVRNLIVGTREDSPRLIALALVAMLWTTSGAIGVIERVESRLLDCARHDVVTGRLRNIALGALIAAMVVVAVVVAPVMRDAAGAVGRVLPGGVLLAVNALGSIAAFTAVYRWAPRSRLRWRSAVRGALPAGVAVQAVPTVVGVYVSATAGFAAVRLFLLLAVILLGLYIMATVMLVGAGLAVRAEVRTRGRETARAPGGPERMAPARQAEHGTVA